MGRTLVRLTNADAGGVVVSRSFHLCLRLGELGEQSLETRFLSGPRDSSHGCRGFHWIWHMAACKIFRGTHAGRHCVNVAECGTTYIGCIYCLGNMQFRSAILDCQALAERKRILLRSLWRPHNCGMGKIQAAPPLPTLRSQSQEVNWHLRLVLPFSRSG